MKSYYPEWAAYPAYIWRGWGYVDHSNNHNNDNQNTQPVENTPVDTGVGDSGGGE